MTITQQVFDRIMRKNGRARKRMARRYMNKAFEYHALQIGVKAAQSKPYSPFEFELANHVARGWSAKTRRTVAKRNKDLEKSVASEMWRKDWKATDARY